MHSWLKSLRRWRVGHEHELVADSAKADAEELAATSPEAKLRDVLRTPKGRDKLFMGRLASSGDPVQIALEDLIGVSLWSTGGTGSGKSAHNLATELGLITATPRSVFWKIDAKGEAAPWYTDLFLPATLSNWSEADQARFFESYRVVNPFDPGNLPPMNVLVLVSDLPRALHAKEVAVLVAETLGAGGVMGHRMTTVLTFAVRLALSIGGLSLLEVRSILTNPNYLNGLLRFSDDTEVKEYFLYRFPKESKEALLAVVSRLDLLLLVEDTARVLGAVDTINIYEWVERGVTICNFGECPRGAEYLGSFWLGLMFRSLARAVMGRPLSPATLPLFAGIDEWQTALDEDLARHFERLLTLSRFKRASWWLTNQLAGQIGSRNPQLLATLKNSCGVQIAFRQSHEDAQAMAYMLPEEMKAGCSAKPSSRQDRTAEFARLPDRTFWFYWKKKGLEAVKLVAPTVNFDKAKRAADQASKNIRDACRGRVGGLSREKLDQVLDRRRAHIEAVANGMATTGSPDWTGRVAEVQTATPDDRDEPLKSQAEATPPKPKTADAAGSASQKYSEEKIMFEPDSVFPYLG